MPASPADPAALPPSPLRSFGRIKGRPLRACQSELYESALPQLAAPLMSGKAFDLPALFPDCRQFALEIGFGGGEHLVGQAMAKPDWGFLGAEPFQNGVAKCLAGLSQAGLLSRPQAPRVRLYPGDARNLLPLVPDNGLAAVYLLFPDPWPKARHRKRRILQPDFAAEIARILTPGGEFRMATDWRDYAAEALGVLLRTRELHWLADRPDDWRRPPPDHVATRYEAKALGDTPPIWLRFRKVPIPTIRSVPSRPGPSP